MPLHILFRTMILGWLVLVLILSVVVARLTHSRTEGNLLTFLFTRPQQQEARPVNPLPPQVLPPPVVEETPLPVVAAPPEAPPAPVQEWLPLPRGKKTGRGELKAPIINVLLDGNVELLFAYAGERGEVSSFPPLKEPSMTVDLHGVWTPDLHIDKVVSAPAVHRLQIHTHGNFLRISASSAQKNSNVRLREQTLYSPSHIRVLFSIEKEE